MSPGSADGSAQAAAAEESEPQLARAHLSSSEKILVRQPSFLRNAINNLHHARSIPHNDFGRGQKPGAGSGRSRRTFGVG